MLEKDGLSENLRTIFTHDQDEFQPILSSDEILHKVKEKERLKEMFKYDYSQEVLSVDALVAQTQLQFDGVLAEV